MGRTESRAEESTKPHTQTKTDREIIVFSAPTKVTTEAQVSSRASQKARGEQYHNLMQICRCKGWKKRGEGQQDKG